MKIETSDRRLLMWAGALMLLVIVALAFLSEDEEESSVPSTYSAQSKGAKAAFLLLQEAGYNVERWEQPPSGLPDDPADTVLVLASPFRSPSRDDRNALNTYLTRGGKILAAGSNAASYLPHAETESEPLPAPSWKEYQPQLLSLIGRAQMTACWPITLMVTVPLLFHTRSAAAK
jgi:hypothetical protein